MADVSPGLMMRQFAWAHDWHVREEGYKAAHAILINAQRKLPLSSMWGDGTTSASDGQYFQAGGHGDAIGDLNARYGPNPGAKFYRFTLRPVWRVGSKGRCQLVVTPLRRERVLNEIQKLSAP